MTVAGNDGSDQDPELAKIRARFNASRAAKLAMIGEPGQPPGLVTRTFDKIEPESVEWLWEGLFPFAKFVTLDGKPGVGKSVLILDIAAHAMRGDGYPNGSPAGSIKCTHVMVASKEDSYSDTIVPRFLAAGGNLPQMHTLEGVRTSSGFESFSFPKHVGWLRETLRELEIQLLILDPLYSYLDPTINAQNNQEIRRACESMTEVADGSRCTILGVRHLAKGQSGIALEQGLGAMSLIGVARHGLTVGADPTDATGTRRVLAVCKANLAERATSLCYEIEPSEDDPKVPRIRWGEASPLQADDLVSGSEDSEARVERTEASEFLWDLTADGPVTCDYARTQLKAAHLFRSDRTTRRAAKDARLVAIPSKTRQPTWFWGRRGQIAPPSLANPEQASDASVDGQAGLNRDYGEIGPSVANPEDVATLEADPATIRLNDL